MPAPKKDLKKTGGRGVKMLKQLISAHKSAEEEHDAVVATLQTYTLNYVSLEKAPTITEDRLEFITTKFNTLPLGKLMNSDAIMKGIGPFATLQHTDQFVANTVVKMSNLFGVMFDDHYLRIHCEIAHALKCNLADIIVLESLLVDKWLSVGADMSCIEEDCVTTDALPFPPVILLVVFVLITPISTLSVVFHCKITTNPTLHGDPPTFGRLLLNAVSKPKWPILVNWVGCFSVLFCLPIWFPKVAGAFSFQIPLNLIGEKCCIPIVISLGQPIHGDGREELREGLLGTGGQQKKPPVKKGAKITAPSDIPKKDASEINLWRVNITGKDGEPAVCDLSKLVMVPPRFSPGMQNPIEALAKSHPSPTPLTRGNAAISVAKAVCMRHNTVCMFMPFGIFQRASDKEQPSETRKGGIRKGQRAAEKEKSTDADNSSLEWQGSVFPDQTWDGSRVCEESDDSEPEASLGERRKSATTNESSICLSRNYSVSSSCTTTVERERYDSRRSTGSRREQRGGIEDDVAVTVFIKRLSRYAVAAHRSSKRLHDRLRQKLREPFCCRRHIYEQLRYFCPHDRSLICEQCTREKYAGKNVLSLVSHCSSEIQRLSEKESELQRLVKAAHDLTIALPVEKDSLHRHVDDEIDSLVSALNERRTSLHTDIDNRKQMELAAIEREISICEGERRTLDTAHLVLEGLARGDATVVPQSDPMGGVLRQTATYDEFWKSADIRLHRPMGIHTWLRLLLPVEELKKSADRLDWSVPKQYLSCRAYPPPDARCPTLPSTTEVVSTVTNGKKYATGNPIKWVRGNERIQDIELAQYLADSLESVQGLVYSSSWRNCMKNMFTSHKAASNTILSRDVTAENPKMNKLEVVLFDAFKHLLQQALSVHISDGKFVSDKHPASKLTSEQFASDLQLLPELERRRLVSVDTLDASTSFSQFVQFVHSYYGVYARDDPLV